MRKRQFVTLLVTREWLTQSRDNCEQHYTPHASMTMGALSLCPFQTMISAAIVADSLSK